MDWLDWVVRAAGAVFGLLTLAFGMSRATAFTERDTSPLWWVAFAAVGATWAVAQIADWTMPISTILYLANGGNNPRAAQVDGKTICIPAKSYDGFTWRFAVPAQVTFSGEGGEDRNRIPIGKGTWFINLSSTLVTADMYESSGSVAYDALFAKQSQAIKVSSKYGRPFRMFTQLPLDRIYSPDGDVAEASYEGACRAGGEATRKQ